MKYFTLAILCLLLTGCTVEMEVPEHRHNASVTISYEVYDYECYEEPYWEMPDWCDYYDDGGICCVWYVDGWYEEWCKWHYDDWCWQFVGYW